MLFRAILSIKQDYASKEIAKARARRLAKTIDDECFCSCAHVVDVVPDYEGERIPSIPLDQIIIEALRSRGIHPEDIESTSLSLDGVGLRLSALGRGTIELNYKERSLERRDEWAARLRSGT